MTTFTIELKGNIRSKKNSKRVFCRGKFPVVLPSEAHEKWEKETLPQLPVIEQPLETTTNITISFYPNTKRKFDLTNYAESVMDLLVKGGIIKDDNYSVVPELTLRYGYVEEGGRCVVEITG